MVVVITKKGIAKFRVLIINEQDKQYFVTTFSKIPECSSSLWAEGSGCRGELGLDHSLELELALPRLLPQPPDWSPRHHCPPLFPASNLCLYVTDKPVFPITVIIRFHA